MTVVICCIVTSNKERWRHGININCVNFWVFPRRLVYIGRRFGTLCQVHTQKLTQLILNTAKVYNQGWYQYVCVAIYQSSLSKNVRCQDVTVVIRNNITSNTTIHEEFINTL
jgi:hypothetical protein